MEYYKQYNHHFESRFPYVLRGNKYENNYNGITDQAHN